jgi:hypothetical protein
VDPAGVLSMTSAPPIRCIRSRMLTRPMPLEETAMGSNPVPSSDTSMIRPSFAQRVGAELEEGGPHLRQRVLGQAAQLGDAAT